MSYKVINAMTGAEREVENFEDVVLCVGLSEGNVLDLTDGIDDLILHREVKDDEEPVESLGAFNMYWLNTAGDLNYPEFREFVNDFPVSNPELWDSYCESTMPF